MIINDSCRVLKIPDVLGEGANSKLPNRIVVYDQFDVCY